MENEQKDEVNAVSLPLKLMGVVLGICFLVTIGHKYYGEKMALMFMPCHVVTGKYLFRFGLNINCY